MSADNAEFSNTEPLVEEKYLQHLDRLKERGIVDIYEGTQQLREEFPELKKNSAIEIFIHWWCTFTERQKVVEEKPYFTKAEKTIYVIFRYTKDKGVQYTALPLSTLERGLFDWSGGREVLGNLQRSSMGGLDIYTTEIDWEEAYEINEKGKTPPRPKIP